MCLIAYQPPGDPTFEENVLENGWQANSHGAGYMFAAGGKLVIRKPFYSLKALREAYTKDHAAHGASSAFALHFRYATHGDKGKQNVHPHILAGGNVGLVHNGILWEFDFGDAEDSDTVTFCKSVLACRSAENLLSAEVGAMLAELIGASNKFVMMDCAGNVEIVNETSGQWDGNRWFSNSGYQDSKLASLPPTSWTPMPIDRGHGFSTTSDAVAGFRRQFAKPERSASLASADSFWGRYDEWDNDRLDDDAPKGDPTIEDEIDRIDLEIADAHLAGNEALLDDLRAERGDLERERGQWADAELAMARDGY